MISLLTCKSPSYALFLSKVHSDVEAQLLSIRYRLINNAGVMALPERTLSTDGFEMQFASNHLGPFIFTNTILPALKRSSDPRIVVVSSWGHHLSNFIFEDPNAEQSYDKWKRQVLLSRIIAERLTMVLSVRYGSTKTANVQFAVGLTKKKGIKSISLHPGAIRTELLRYMTKEDELAMGECRFSRAARKEKREEWKKRRETKKSLFPSRFSPSSLYLSLVASCTDPLLVYRLHQRRWYPWRSIQVQVSSSRSCYSHRRRFRTQLERRRVPRRLSGTEGV